MNLFAVDGLRVRERESDQGIKEVHTPPAVSVKVDIVTTHTHSHLHDCHCVTMPVRHGRWKKKKGGGVDWETRLTANFSL